MILSYEYLTQNGVDRLGRGLALEHGRHSSNVLTKNVSCISQVQGRVRVCPEWAHAGNFFSRAQ